jgi:hypothetical protein
MIAPDYKSLYNTCKLYPLIGVGFLASEVLLIYLIEEYSSLGNNALFEFSNPLRIAVENSEMEKFMTRVTDAIGQLQF